MKEPERKKSEVQDKNETKEPIVKKFLNSFKDMWRNPVTRYCSIAGALRSVVIFSFDYFMPLFFILTYPDKKVQFSILWCTMNVFLGSTSSIIGGILGSKLGPRNFSYICQASALISLPFLWITLL